MNPDRLKELGSLLTSTDDRIVKQAVAEVAVTIISAHFELQKKKVDALTRMADALTLIAERKGK